MRGKGGREGGLRTNNGVVLRENANGLERGEGRGEGEGRRQRGGGPVRWKRTGPARRRRTHDVSLGDAVDRGGQLVQIVDVRGVRLNGPRQVEGLLLLWKRGAGERRAEVSVGVELRRGWDSRDSRVWPGCAF